MANAKYDFGLVDAIRAEALGEPGQRRFRLLLEGPGGNACLWLEKNQLFQLSVVIQQMLVSLSSQESSEEYRQPGIGSSGQEHAAMEFNVGNLSLGHDPGRDLFLIDAHDIEDEQEEEALLRFWASRSQLNSLADEAQTVCAAGRPLCPLCSAPRGPEAHICPKSNGHYSL
ncbi:MAG: DUF3090 family protein [Dehalococcoidia bacterium]|jgi:uncharacterized repeat protein (TIGR03847 family)|nr:DUF3090 family protein [Dehalococcoidia bacterium]